MAGNNLVRQLVGVALFLALTLAAVVVFLRVFAPREPLAKLPPLHGFDPAAMRAAVTPEAVAAQQELITSFGSRLLGQEGFYKTGDEIRRQMTDAGLEVFEQSLATVAPKTLDRAIEPIDDAGPLEGVAVYPFLPNFLQPMVTPAEGLTGTLLVVNSKRMLSRERFDDAIAVVDLAEPPETFGSSWTKYAQVGFKAVILTNSLGFEKIDFATGNAGAIRAPVNFVRLAAGPEILACDGRKVRLRVRTAFEDMPNTTLVGVLHSDKPTKEALVLNAAYDAPSTLPDLAPGVLAAVSPAVQLQLIKGLSAYKGTLKRDVVFVFNGSQSYGHHAVNVLLQSIGSGLDPEGARIRIARDLAADRAALLSVAAAEKTLASPGFLEEMKATEAAVAALSPADRDFTDEQFRFVLNTLVEERSEAQLQARLEFLRTGQDPKGEPFRQYMAAKATYDAAMDVAGYQISRLAEKRASFAKEADVPGRLQRRLELLLAFHESSIDAGEKALKLHALFRNYDKIAVLASHLLPADPEKVKGEAMTFYMGEGVENEAYVQHPSVNNLVLAVIQAGGLGKSLRFDPMQSARHGIWANPKIAGIPVEVDFWNLAGYPGFTLVNSDRTDSYALYGSPIEKPFMREMGTITTSLQAVGDTALSMALGLGDFLPSPKPKSYTFNGKALVANVGQSIVPNFPLAGGIVCCKTTGAFATAHGCVPLLMLRTDPYGRYCLPESVARFTPDLAYSPGAVGYGPDGLIRLIKDESKVGQEAYRSSNISLWVASPENVNIVTFRAAPVTVFDLINPQTLKAYTSVELIDREGLSGLGRINTCPADDLITTFVEPDKFFFIKLRAGSPDNELVQATRAFILGDMRAGAPSRAGSNGAPYAPDPSKEIDGPGFLVSDTPLLLDIPRRIAESMASVNGRRLELQNKYAMADQRTNDFHERTLAYISEASAPGLPKHEQTLAARDAVTYATLNHPVLRRSITEAVVGILWYLGLLVPFVFFFEKLVFGFSDIRRQLAAHAAIFLSVFLLLWLLHPAFQMIRSSIMILLGFVIMLISGGITLLSTGKFQENLESLRKRRGIVTSAEANTMGVIGTAFMLGLNNMHRRRVRTGLTCATLVLITFAMICFTSIQSNLVDKAVALGKAPFQGFLVRSENFAPVSGGELFSLQTKFGQAYKVAPRYMYVGERTWQQQQFNPEFDIVFEPEGATPARIQFKSMLVFAPDEPLRGHINLAGGRGWFTKEQVKAPGDKPLPVAIPDVMARKLNITPAMIEAEPPKVKINGKPCEVVGIFDASEFSRLHDITGRGLLPFDVEGMVNVRKVGDEVLADEDTDPMLSAEQVVLTCKGFPGEVPHGRQRMVSVAVALEGLSYKKARDTIDGFLEQSGRSAYYGLDGVAYLGKRARENSFAGLLELIIPLVIAALTVLNTMRGSVYERRDEIFVYNAVGIAPRYVFFMFFAEAFVYAVVGSVLGYILSQGTGRILTTLGLTGGLNMTFTSVSTILASMAITVAVFVSTYFPAKSAMEIAEAADDAGWALPEPVGDTMTFALPFTFDYRDRVAVLAFFERFLQDHGEGSAGPFFAGLPRVGISGEADPLAPDSCTPQVATTIWLKPFDLGVSQEMTIWLPTDPETKEFIARISLTRLSGTRESWKRLNVGFVRRIRKHFLYWRAVGPDERQDLFQEARQMLEAHVGKQSPSATTGTPGIAGAAATEVARG
ncbi:MAG: hypothetical protein NTW19_09155 [Planctomycetota bacterium]|nr:hypothetical protein [Planctomycetota bacterium]